MRLPPPDTLSHGGVTRRPAGSVRRAHRRRRRHRALLSRVFRLEARCALPLPVPLSVVLLGRRFTSPRSFPLAATRSCSPFAPSCDTLRSATHCVRRTSRTSSIVPFFAVSNNRPQLSPVSIFFVLMSISTQAATATFFDNAGGMSSPIAAPPAAKPAPPHSTPMPHAPGGGGHQASAPGPMPSSKPAGAKRPCASLLLSLQCLCSHT